MNGPFPLEELDLSTINVTRRIPVNSVRRDGGRDLSTTLRKAEAMMLHVPLTGFNTIQ